MQIEIRNCNNIDSGSIQIDENRLNIKYAMNGTGKSTIARAIELNIKGNDSINELLPFKHVDSKSDADKPTVKGLTGVSTVAIFNDSYIDQYAFKQDEIIANSFEIFVKTPDYDTRIAKIEELITEIKATFKDSEEIDQVIADLGTLSESFGKSKSGYSEASALAKGIGKGNKIANVPKGLESYTAYLKSSANSKWLRWQIEGNNYSNLSENCPYCTSPTESKKEIIAQVSKEFDAKSIEHLNKLVSVLENLSKYFSPDANDKLKQLTNNVQGFSKEEISYLLRIKEQIDLLKSKMLNLKGLTFFSMKDVGKIADYFEQLKIQLDFLPELNSENTEAIVKRINASLDNVLRQVGVLQGEVNQQNILIKRTIEENKVEINSFLRNAGYKYHVDVEYADSKYKMKLKHFDSERALENGSQHLSYGEKNAFSLVLFMYECKSKNPDIIVLDDPISSFDKNKKYAVIDMLFRGKKSLKTKTVLMMTHDLEPVIDILYNLPKKFDPTPTATFIETKMGVIREIPITKNDISTFAHICNENVINSNVDVVKLVYLRRYFEIHNNRGLAYELLSNLIHKRAKPIKLPLEDQIELTPEEISIATEEIRKIYPGFNYNSLLSNLTNNNYMKNAYRNASNNYEKLQIFRVLKDQEQLADNDVIKKFINETFHIENEYIMQINPCKYEIVPAFIIAECDAVLN
jgi:energy-coupling factor transporter ATP-binding protein EcfA2